MSDAESEGVIPAGFRVLLVQIRDSPEVAAHERAALMGVTGLRDEHIDPLNVVREPRVDWGRVEAADAVIIGGAGVHSAVEDYDFSDSLAGAIERMASERTPLFGSCYGHQLIARVLGGRVVHDETRSEVGAVEVSGTGAAGRDPLFGACPDRYTVLMGHHDRVDALPPGAVEMARSERCDNQAFRIDGLPIWGTQFHAELTPERLMERLARYRQYVPSDEGFEAVRRGLEPTPHAQGILRRFLSLCVSGIAR